MKSKRALIRFYEELNDFLPPSRRCQDFSHSFGGKPGIKDVIEALGAPHTEVDLILVNGKPVDFSYHLQDGDRVAVYPVFESFEIAGLSPLRDRPLRDPRFILDVHLGRLARRLRLLGFDSLYENDYEDQQMIDLALTEKRIILTRDRLLLKHSRVERGYWVRSTEITGQVREILERFQLHKLATPFRCCSVCNGLIAEVGKEEILSLLPENTARFYSKFYRCRGCARIYWKGPHYLRLREFFKKVGVDGD